MNTQKQQLIKDVHAACPDFRERIEKEFGELFPLKLEVGKWYKNADFPNIVYMSEILSDRIPSARFKTFAKGYGFSFEKTPVWRDELFFADSRDFALAIPEEIKTALDGERVKRGLVDGVKVSRSMFSNPLLYDCVLGDLGSETKYLPHSNSLSFGSYLIFFNGTWATPIPTAKKMTVKEIVEALGHDVEIVK